MKTFSNAEDYRAAKAAIEARVAEILTRVAGDTEGLESRDTTLKTVPAGRLIHCELKTDSRASLTWFHGHFTSLQITLDRWTGRSVRRSVKIDGTALPEGAEAKIEAKARELAEMALRRDAQQQEARKIADEREQAAFHARLEARDAGFSPKPRYDGAVVLEGTDATYEFGEELRRRVTVLHDQTTSRLALNLSLSPAKLTEALELAQKIQALIDEEVGS